MLEKTFQPADIEGPIYERWQDAGAFKAGARAKVVGKSGGADPYCIVIPPPNVTGSLHMGHALNNTLQDVLIRFERMRGKDVLWQPGTDHAGIATQSVVERQLARRQQPGRRDMGREAFIQRVWEWKEESGGTIIHQLKRLGASCDWSRERFTMGKDGSPNDPMVQAVIKTFVELHRAGLIYRDKRLVNWDPALQTAISDLEVDTREVPGHMWHFAYPLKDGPIDGIEEIVIATTRPETMLGDGAVAVHPSDERYKNLIGKLVRLPVAERYIPIIADEYPDPEFGSGAVKITGAHDFNDFEVARRHDIPLLPLMDERARMMTNVPERYVGMDRFEARKKVVEEIEAQGLLRKVEDRVIPQPFGDRSGVVLEPYLTDQWYVNAGELAKEAMAAVEDGRTKIVPASGERTYFEWMRNIQPWCVSRQLWWGHQIPAWYGPDGEIFVASDEQEAETLARQHYGNTPFALTRDEDVLDTWFSSALWPFSTLGWPETTPELDRYYPTATLVTGFDILFFWVARMMMMGLHFMKEVPFHTVYLHALVRDEKGQKMSKSKGNVMDPLDIVDGIDLDTLIQKRVSAPELTKQDAAKIASDTKKAYPNGIAPYGADALRFTLASMAAQGRDIKLAMPVVEGYRNFATKIWNAARFGEMNGCAPSAGFDPASATLVLNRWIAGETQRTAAAVTQGIEQHRYNEAAAAIYQFVWNTFCDWYIELAKPALTGPDGPVKDETRATFSWVFDRILTLLHPFMPFITEELWGRIGEAASREAMLILTPWPELSGLEDAAADAEMNWVVDLIAEIRSVRSEMNIPPAAQLPLLIVGASEDIRARAGRHRETLSRLARLASIDIADAAPKGALQIVTREATLALPVAGIIDIDAEIERLKREIARLSGEIEKLDQKLADEKFTARAPEHVVEENRERRAQAAATVIKLQDALKRLEAAH